MMSVLECKKSLRKLELESYSLIISTFRAQGNLTERKIELLKELRGLFRIPIDRHKAELRRAANDESLHKIARRLSGGQCFSNEWNKHSKRFVPIIPRLNNESDTFYRILADHIVSKSQVVLDLYPPPSNENNNDLNDYEMNEINLEDENQSNHVYVNNLTDKINKLKEKIQTTSSENKMEPMSQDFNQDKSNDICKSTDNQTNLNNTKPEKSLSNNSHIAQESLKPSDFLKKYESQLNDEVNDEVDDEEQDEISNKSNRSFLKRLVHKFKQQKQQKLNAKNQNQEIVFNEQTPHNITEYNSNFQRKDFISHMPIVLPKPENLINTNTSNSFSSNEYIQTSNLKVITYSDLTQLQNSSSILLEHANSTSNQTNANSQVFPISLFDKTMPLQTATLTTLNLASPVLISSSNPTTSTTTTTVTLNNTNTNTNNSSPNIFTKISNNNNNNNTNLFSTNTIVKLNPTQINFNNKAPIKKSSVFISATPTTPTTNSNTISSKLNGTNTNIYNFNNNTNNTNGCISTSNTLSPSSHHQPLKHFLIPKSNPKLIIKTNINHLTGTTTLTQQSQLNEPNTTSTQLANNINSNTIPTITNSLPVQLETKSFNR